MKSNPRIGIIGSGAIGGFYGLMLARGGGEVHFLLRSEYAAVAAKGIHVRSAVHGDLTLEKVHAYNNAKDIPPCDWVLVGTKSTSNADLAPLIQQIGTPSARVVILQNGLGVEDPLRPLLPPSMHLIGGLCFICVYRKAPGVIEHLAHSDVRLGYHSGPAETPPAQQAILEAGAALFHAAGIKAEAVPDLLQARWQKLVWNVPYNGLSVVLNAGTLELMGHPATRELIGDIMREVIASASKCGHPLPIHLVERMMATTDATPNYFPSMYLDHVQRRPMELAAIYAAPLAAARRAGSAMPKAEVLYQALSFIDVRNAKLTSDTAS